MENLTDLEVSFLSMTQFILSEPESSLKNPSKEHFALALRLACGIIEGLTDKEASIRELQRQLFHAQRKNLAEALEPQGGDHVQA